MRITPVSKSYMSYQRDESEEGKRQRLLSLIKELSYTDPRIAKINKDIASHGGVSSEICSEILSELSQKKDRRSRRVVQIISRMMRCSDVDY